MPQRLDRRKRSTTASVHRKMSSSFHETTAINLNPDQWLLPETAEYLRNNDKAPMRASPRNQNAQRHPSLDQTLPTDIGRGAATAFDEVRSYLKKNSLVAKGLTIFDVLQPTSVNIKEPQHIQVIDRYVLSKVWNDISPLIYGSYAKKFRMVNQYAANLEKYEENLKELLTHYHQFLSKFIWKCLNDDGKQKLGPHLYWIILSPEDQLKYAREITEDEHRDQNALELYVWRKLTSNKQKEFLEKPVLYHEKTATVLEIALRDAEDSTALDGVARMNVEIKRAVKFLQISTDLRQYQKRAETETKEKPRGKTTARPKSVTSHRLAQRVLCRYDGDGRFYPGTVQIDADGRSIVYFDMDVEQDVIGHVLLPIDHSSSQLNLVLLDSVLVRQSRETEEAWVPGIVKWLPAPLALPPRLYLVEIYDPKPRCIYVRREDLFRITWALFQRAVTYIQNVESPSISKSFDIQVPEPTPAGPSVKEIEDMLREVLDPLSEKIDHIDRSHKKRYHQLQSDLEDQMGAIRRLQEEKARIPVKQDGSQTDRIITTPPPEPIIISSPVPPPITVPPSPSPPADPTLKPGTHVYALWPDDYLFHECVIVKSNGNESYKVERFDFPHNPVEINRQDIFLDSDRRRLKDLKPRSFALIEYPHEFLRRWWPAVILSRQSSTTQVRFCDCLELELNGDQYAIPIDALQFKTYVTDRIKKEKSLIGQVTVGLNHEKRALMLGTVEDRTGLGHDYVIKWCDGSTSEEKEEHLFGAFSYRYPLQPGIYVLAPDDDEGIYRPALIQKVSDNEKTLRIEYLLRDSGPKEVEISTNKVFVITEAYFKRICPVPKILPEVPRHL